MKKYSFMFLTVLVSFCILNMSLALAEDEYIEVLGKIANIRTAPTMSSQVIISAIKGDVFRLVSEEGKWCGIAMFSGEWRYIYKSLTRKINYNIVLPTSVSTRRSLYKSFAMAEDRAQMEADQTYPMATRYGHLIEGNFEKNVDYMRFLGDRYKLEVCHEFGVKSPVYHKIAVEGTKKEWPLPPLPKS